MFVDPVLVRINEGMALPGPQRRDLFERIRAGTDDPLHVCVLAHSMADVQDDVHEELVWDERALAAIGSLTDARLAEAGVPFTVAALYPSLYLNLADCHRRLGDPARAREYLEQARSRMGALGDDDYGNLIRSGLEDLERQL
ncbi:tetratricopeptide repeat protein [Actinoplanes couchii]|uniref:Tetratricopeptide repeat protein n=1 Tax=Actinoplanes couchii TaxID=403638 RepID=A0ABQ3XL96_9ACTN|nr:tetratricopeptide repeat protein [Actinoplanes couchii]MDR6319434.1 hypothetical protein [Actinoplanes couchii]GID59175.1 hypothetical protein Aco03nite_075790 [Actinoplanes couchii]